MATLNMSPKGQAVKGRTKASLPTVDLTAMVDLAFLLITFFMLTTSLSKMKEMPIVKPVDGPETAWPASRTMTILLCKNSKAAYYLGNPENAEMKIVPLASLNHQILNIKKSITDTHLDQAGKRMLVIIKPTALSRYQNLVDVLDEMEINGISSYAISDQPILAKESRFLKESNLL